MKTLPTLLCTTLAALAVEPQPNGVRIAWNRGQHETSYGVWQNISPSTNWVLLGTSIATNWIVTNAVGAEYNWGVTALRMSNGVILPSIDVGIAHWPPSITTPARTVKLTPTGGYALDTNRWVRISSDLATYSDWMRFNVAGGRVLVEHLASPARPFAFFAYPVSQVAPVPASAPPLNP